MGAYKVRRFEKVEDYLSPHIEAPGKVIVSSDTWDEAVEWRDHYREQCPSNYYNITHSTDVAVVAREEDESDGN
jgi:hypothetical protein